MKTFSHHVSEHGHWVSNYHPYDLANYPFAWSQDGRNWGVFLDVKTGFCESRRDRIGSFVADDPAHVSALLAEYEKPIRSVMDRS